MEHQKVIYRLGDVIRITAGAFAGFAGKVEGINQSKKLLKVQVEIFGRDTPVEVSFSEAEQFESRRPFPPPTSNN